MPSGEESGAKDAAGFPSGEAVDAMGSTSGMMTMDSKRYSFALCGDRPRCMRRGMGLPATLLVIAFVLSGTVAIQAADSAQDTAAVVADSSLDNQSNNTVSIPPAIADAASSTPAMRGAMTTGPTVGGVMPGTTVGGAMPGAPGTDAGPAGTTVGGVMPGSPADPKMGAANGTQGDLPEDSDSLLGPEPPTRVRVAILDATGKAGGANKVAVLLSEVKRQSLEDQIGLQVEVVNLSTAEAVRPGQSILFYRPEFLRAALAMAKAIPGEQFVMPMRPAEMKRAGVDVEIVVGKELP
jgi:hypothetical protein